MTDARVPIRIRHGGRVVVAGHVEGDVYATPRDPERHLFRDLNGWGIDIDVLERLERLGVRTVRVLTPDTTYTSPLRLLRAHGRHLRVPGWGHQLVLPLRHWRAEDPDAVAGVQSELF